MKLRKNVLCAVLALALAAMSLAGCSLFSTDSGDGDKETGSGAVEMTDKYTFEDPADLEFAKRYVLYADENSQAVAAAKDYGIVAMYSIIYADQDDQPVADYEFIICDTEEHAQDAIDLYAAQGQTLNAAEADPLVLYAVVDGDAFAGSLTALQSAGVLSDTTVSAYTEFYTANMGGTVQ